MALLTDVEKADRKRLSNAVSNAKWSPVYQARRRAKKVIWALEHANEIEAAKLAKKQDRNAKRNADRKANPEKRKGERKRYNEKITANRRAERALWIATHPIEIVAHRAEMDRRLQERKRIKRHNRRARERSLGGKLSQGLADKLIDLQGGKCPVCRESLPDKVHLDHVIPLAGGGTNTDDNIQVLCPKCNFAKRDIHPVDFMQSRGFLL